MIFVTYLCCWLARKLSPKKSWIIYVLVDSLQFKYTNQIIASSFYPVNVWATSWLFFMLILNDFRCLYQL